MGRCVCVCSDVCAPSHPTPTDIQRMFPALLIRGHVWMQVLVIIGLAEVRSQIDTHMMCQTMTMILASLQAMLVCFEADRIIAENVRTRIVELEFFLKCPFNRNVSKFAALCLRAGFVVLLGVAMPTAFDFDWSWDPKCHRYERGRDSVCDSVFVCLCVCVFIVPENTVDFEKFDPSRVCACEKYLTQWETWKSERARG